MTLGEKKSNIGNIQSNIQIKFGKILIFQHHLDIPINKYKSGVLRSKHGNQEYIMTFTIRDWIKLITLCVKREGKRTKSWDKDIWGQRL